MYIPLAVYIYIYTHTQIFMNLLVKQRCDQCVGLLLAPVHAQRDADGESADDLLMGGVVRVAQHLLDRLGRRRAKHQQTHRQGGRLTRHRRVVEQDPLELLVEVSVLGAHHRDADAQRAA